MGGIGGGFTVYMDDGYLCADYNTSSVYRYKVRSDTPIATGTIQYRSRRN